MYLLSLYEMGHSGSLAFFLRLGLHDQFLSPPGLEFGLELQTTPLTFSLLCFASTIPSLLTSKMQVCFLKIESY